jgi:predicted nuclease of predicted toxin-antitoxin system
VKLLLDTCVWGGAKVELIALGHDVTWCGEWDADPGDDEILKLAHRERRVLVTLDKDFGELAVVHKLPHSGIVRVVGFAAREQASAAHSVVSSHGEELLQGAIATVSPGQLRVRPPTGLD